MAASTNKKSILIGTRSLQNRKICLVKLFPQLNYLLIFFTSSECCCYKDEIKHFTENGLFT